MSTLDQVSAFEQAAGSPLAIVNVYAGFAAPAPLQILQQIAARGAVPLVSWGCQSTEGVESGRYDTLISSYAAELRQYTHPVFLRWFWEMNLPIAADQTCLGAGGPAGFIAAWRRVRSIFRQAGADNVAFVWCPGVTSDATRMIEYFPGSDYVDWIGADGYDRHRRGSAAFTNVFSGWYRSFQNYGKPMMIAETGAMAADQVEYLAGIQQSLRTSFPLIRALLWFDARGPNGSWVLTGSGLSAWQALAHDPYFAANPGAGSASNS